MAVFVTAALAALLTLLVLAGPGLVAARLACPESLDASSDSRGLLLAAAWGAGVVPTLAFFVHLAGGPYVGLPSMLGVAAVHYAVAGVVSWRRRGRGHDASLAWWWDPMRRVSAGTWFLTVGAGILWLLRYDAAPLPPESSCIYGAALVATGHREEGMSLLFENLEDARLGNSGVIAGFVALYGELGFRLLFAACGALLALGGQALGRLGVRHSAWAGGVGAALLSLNPWVLSLPQADENILALAFMAPSLALLLGKRPPWLVVGVLLGLVLAMRHVLVLAVPSALLWVLWSGELATSPRFGLRRRKAFFLLVLGLVLGTAFEHLHHHLALGSVLRFESNAQFPALPYAFFGVPFRWEGMVNWPLHDALTRTPWNASPMLVMWPLHALKAWGTLLCGVLVVGAISGGIRDRQAALFWACWTGPSAVLLLLQESWDFPNKMGVALVLFAALPWCAVHGIRALWGRRGAVVGLLLVSFVIPLVLAVPAQVPADVRYYERFPTAPYESPSVVQAHAAAARDVGVLPSWSTLVRHGPLFDWDHVVHLVRTLGDDSVRTVMHPWSWGPSETPAQGAPVTVAISPGGPGGSAPRFSITDAPPHLDLASAGAGALAGLEVSWDARSPLVYGLRGERVTAVTLTMPYPDEPRVPCGCAYMEEGFAGPCEDRCSVLFDVAGVAPRGHGVSGEAPFLAPGAMGAPRWPTPVSMKGSEFRVRLPSGAVSFGIVELPFANRLRLWRLEVSADGVNVLDGPRWPWHG